MEKNLNPLYYLEEAIGGATAKRILKSAKKHKKNVGHIIDHIYNKGTAKSKSTSKRLFAKYFGNMGKHQKVEGEKQIGWARQHMKKLQKDGSKLDKSISSRKPGDFAKQFKVDKAKRLNKEKAQKGKDLLDSLL